MACMTKRPQGPPSRHVIESEGPSRYHLNFYSTNYSVQHSKDLAFPPKNFRHKGTGYIANFRPTVYYNKQLDATLNPSIAKLLTGNYNTLTSRDYIAPPLNTGAEQLPTKVCIGPSGFTHNLPITTAPLTQQASNDTSYWSSYPQKEFHSDSTNQTFHTRKEETGFTHAYNLEPITFRPNECHSGTLPGNLTWRPTGRSIMKGDYTQAVPLTGKEEIPLLSSRACYSNGFVKGNYCPAEAQPIDTKGPSLDKLHPQQIHSMSKRDPAMFSLVTHPLRYTSYNDISYPPKKVHPHTNEFRNSTGRKEASGYAENTIPKHPNVDPTQSVTVFRNSYQGGKLVKNPPSADTSRLVHPNGFTKSTCVHQYGPLPSSEEVLRIQKPYVTRSIIARDPLYLDYTYQHKQLPPGTTILAQ